MKSDKCGIYQIQSQCDSKLYIGSSARIYGRWYGHRLMLRKNEHHSKYLQNAWNKHGEENFIFTVIEECAREELIGREDFYIRLLWPAYNMTPGADIGSIGRAVTHCPKGHEYSADNTSYSSNGGRLCRICNRERSAEILVTETSDERAIRLQQLAAYYARTKEAQRPYRQAYLQAHKSEKSEYDKSRRPLANRLRKQRHDSMSAEQRAAYLESKRREHAATDKAKVAEYNRSRLAINNARRNALRAAMSPEQREAARAAKRAAYERRKARLNGNDSPQLQHRDGGH